MTGDLDSQTYLVYQTTKEFESISLEAAYLKRTDRYGDIQFGGIPRRRCLYALSADDQDGDILGGLSRQLLEKNRKFESAASPAGAHPVYPDRLWAHTAFIGAGHRACKSQMLPPGRQGDGD